MCVLLGQRARAVRPPLLPRSWCGCSAASQVIRGGCARRRKRPQADYYLPCRQKITVSIRVLRLVALSPVALVSQIGQLGQAPINRE